MRTILIPVDFSLRSRQALRYAHALAQRDGARLALLHVLPAPNAALVAFDAFAGLPLPHPSSERRLDAESRLAAFAASVISDDTTVCCLVEHGAPAATIVRLAAELPADLLVIGTHARTGVAELLLGSVAHQVMTSAACPVIMLRGDEARAA